jgi:hypothetical protein
MDDNKLPFELWLKIALLDRSVCRSLLCLNREFNRFLSMPEVNALLCNRYQTIVHSVNKQSHTVSLNKGNNSRQDVVYSGGSEIKLGHYKNGKLSGPATSVKRYDDRVKVTKKQYNSGKLHGLYTMRETFLAIPRVAALTVQYNNGKKISPIVTTCGELCKSYLYQSKKAKLAIRWADDGTLTEVMYGINSTTQHTFIGRLVRVSSGRKVTTTTQNEVIIDNSSVKVKLTGNTMTEYSCNGLAINQYGSVKLT